MSDNQEALEIISRITKKIKGSKFIKIPIWEAFADNIVFKNRFLPSAVKEDVNSFLDYILQKNTMRFTIPKGTILYRARRIKRKEIKKDEHGNFTGFSKNESSMPPYRAAPYGRAGTSGIPVFYTSTDRETCCAELRPSKGEFISIAEFEVQQELLVANFSLEQIESFRGTPEGAIFLKEMFTSFSMPVSNELLDYLPSEYISEYIRTKHTDFFGIRYSSLHNQGGYNIALFSDKQCEFKGSFVVECTYVKCEFQNINTRN